MKKVIAAVAMMVASQAHAYPPPDVACPKPVLSKPIERMSNKERSAYADAMEAQGKCIDTMLSIIEADENRNLRLREVQAIEDQNRLMRSTTYCHRIGSSVICGRD